MTKKRVYQIAKEFGMSSKQLIKQMQEFGIEVSSHMSTVESEEIKIFKEILSSKEVEKEPNKSKCENKKTKNKKNKSNNKKDETLKNNEQNNNKNMKVIEIEESIVVKDLAEKMDISPNQLISKLMTLGVMANINQDIDSDTASVIADEFGYLIEKISKEEEKDFTIQLDVEDNEKDLELRPPIVTVMGHVDHGKTSLLDAIRETHVTEREAGGITQHIGASTVEINNNKIVFLDTPGHEAFTAMRARGAQVTDIAVLVVAADDGVMPQTVEAINHSKAANVPIIIAVNKIDKLGANPDRVKQELTEYGLVPEEWGGDTIIVHVSALKKQGIDELLEMILLVAEMQELKANPNRNAVGTIIESELDKGRGSVATVIIQKGTLKVGDAIVSGTAYGKVRSMIDEKGKRVRKVGPASAVEISGFSEVPNAGDRMYVVEEEKIGRDIAKKEEDKIKQEKLKATKKVSLDDLFDQIKKGEVKDLNLIIKADVKGSIEAVKQSLQKLSNEEVKVNTIHGGVGAISETDINLASASNAIVIGFNVRPTTSAMNLAKRENVDIRTYRIIYNAIEDVEAAINGMLEPEYKEVVIGRAEVRATFKVPNIGTVAGIYVQNGKITRNSTARLLRDNIVIHEGEISSLKRFKNDVKEVASGYEGGLGIYNYNDIKEGDIIEAYIMEEVKR